MHQKFQGKICTGGIVYYLKNGYLKGKSRDDELLWKKPNLRPQEKQKHWEETTKRVEGSTEDTFWRQKQKEMITLH